MRTTLHCVISVCAARDLDVWGVAAKHVVQHIPSKHYWVIVPDHEVPLFECQSPPVYRILPESAWVADVRPVLQNALPDSRKHRLGWYLQQFIKLAALQPHAPDDQLLIWDADTVPLRDLVFTEAETLSCYTHKKIHRPYFDCIERLLQMRRMTDYSFIGQSLPLKAAWAHSLFAELELKYGRPWWLAIINHIDFSAESGFSEYETLGTYAMHRFPGELHPNHRSWFRFGNARIGSAHNLDNPRARLLLRGNDFVSFESWEQPYSAYPRFLRRLMQRLLQT